jgi:hypothetical protein
MKPLISIFILLLAVAVAGAAETLDTAKAAFDAGDFRGCLTKIAAAMPQPPKAGTTPDPRYDFLILRGEAQLKLKQSDGAATAFTQAATAAPGDKERGVALATAGLIKASPQLLYKSGGESIDIVAADSRAKALPLFIEQRSKALEQSVTKAVAVDNLNATRSLLPAMKDLFAMETGVNGEAKQTSAASAKLASHVGDLVGKELKRIDKRTEYLGVKANKRVTITQDDGVTLTSINARQNLVTTEARELRETAKTLDELKAFVDQFKEVTLAADQDSWAGVSKEVDGSIKKISDVLAREPKH